MNGAMLYFPSIMAAYTFEKDQFVTNCAMGLNFSMRYTNYVSTNFENPKMGVFSSKIVLLYKKL